MYTLSFIDNVGNFFNSIKDWFLDNVENPLLWLGIVFVVITIFAIAYNALHGRN